MTTTAELRERWQSAERAAQQARDAYCDAVIDRILDDLNEPRSIKPFLPIARLREAVMQREATR